jgi:hypothetical protein
METKKLIVTLLILTVVLSIVTVVLSMRAGERGVTLVKSKGVDSATVQLFIEGGESTPKAASNEASSVGLNVEGGK